MPEVRLGPFQFFCCGRYQSVLTATAIRLHDGQYLRLRALFCLPHALLPSPRNCGVKLTWNQENTSSFPSRRQGAPSPIDNGAVLSLTSCSRRFPSSLSSCLSLASCLWCFLNTTASQLSAPSRKDQNPAVVSMGLATEEHARGLSRVKTSSLCSQRSI